MITRTGARRSGRCVIGISSVISGIELSLAVRGEWQNLAALHYWPPPVVGALITTQRVLASGLP
jgi:hypothetical protein